MNHPLEAIPGVRSTSISDSFGFGRVFLEALTMTEKSLLEIEEIVEHTKAIGHVCVYWGAMENRIDQLLELLTPLERDQISESVTANLDIREKLKILKAVGFVRKPNNAWFEYLKSVADLIENELRCKRNRFVHDLWVGAWTQPISRRHRRTSLKRPQARHEPELTTYEDIPCEPQDIWNLVEALRDAQVQLAISANEYREAVSTPRPEQHPQSQKDRS